MSEHGKPSSYNAGCRCPVCTQAKVEYEFKFPSQKPAYKRTYAANKRKQRQVLRDKLKSKPCTDCNQTFPPYCMDFDHIPELGPRLSSVGNIIQSAMDIKRVMEEIAKCELVCANCHRIRTHKRRQRYHNPHYPQCHVEDKT